MIRGELKEKFLKELIPAERVFFLKKAQEAVGLKGYLPGEDLFWFCFYVTLGERLRRIGSQGDGYVKFLFVQGVKDIEGMIREYEERLEKSKQSSPPPEGERFIEYFSE
jgi:hypothetical protein